MPFDIKKSGNKYIVVKKDDGKVMGTHTSKSEAQRQIAAIYANSPKEKWHG